MKRVIGIMLTLVIVGAASAQAPNEPKKKNEPEGIPAPKALVPAPMATIIIEPVYQRSDTRDVWQHYGVNSFGRFVPRVIQTPYGYHYSRDLQPYPWAGTRPRAFMP